MHCSKWCLGTLVTGLAWLTAGCGNFLEGVNIFGPTSPPYRVSGQVIDDSLALPPADSARITVSDVRIEVLDGPDKGRFAITNAAGAYDLGQIASDTRLRATKAGWEPVEIEINGWTWASPWISMSEAPHCLWGFIYLPGGTPIPAQGVRVEVADGPNAGQVTMSDNQGLYRFDNLSTQRAFQVEFSKTGYRTDRITVASLNRNTQLPRTLTAQ